MPKNKVSDPITDQEIAFARLVLSGAMTDRHAAEAVGLNPDSAAYTKSKPHVRDYMLEHRAAVQQRLVQQEADGNAPPQPGPRKSTGPPLGNRQPQPRDDPWQHYRTGQGPLHDHGHGKLHPGSSRRSAEKQSAPAANTNRKPMPPPGPPRLSRHAVEPAQAHQEDGPRRLRQSRRAAERAVEARPRLRGRGASGPRPQPVHL